MASLNKRKEQKNMYAIIETGGKKLDVNEGESYTFDKVVAVCKDDLTLGTPYVEGAKVTCKVEKQGKEKKIVIFKYKQKKGSTRRKQGHRQPYTKLTVESIAA